MVGAGVHYPRQGLLRSMGVERGVLSTVHDFRRGTEAVVSVLLIFSFFYSYGY